MKRFVMIALIVVLAAAGVYCGWRWYSDVYVPNARITGADEQQRQLFSQLSPDWEQTGATPDSAQQTQTDSPERKDSAASYAASYCDALASHNGDAVGWLKIDGTVIDYPVVQTTDNVFYLSSGFNGTENYGLGTPFLDYRCAPDFSDFNSVIYAHHVSGYRAMFSDITYYKDSDFMRQHPYGMLLTEKGVHRVRFFAYMIIPNPSFAYQFDFPSDSDKEAYIDNIFSNAVYPPEVTAAQLKQNKNLHLLLLSTCTYEYWGARGVLAGVIE